MTTVLIAHIYFNSNLILEAGENLILAVVYIIKVA